MHVHHRDRSAATAIFTNGTYFLDNPRIKQIQAGLVSCQGYIPEKR